MSTDDVVTQDPSDKPLGEIQMNDFMSCPQCIVLGFSVQIKYLSADGDVALGSFSSGVLPWEALGMLQTHGDDIREALKGCDCDDE